MNAEVPDRPRLSICMSTYNRAGILGQTLASIVPQLSQDVELVVLDAGSTDDTAAVVGRSASRCEFVRYARLEENLGIDRDFCEVIRLARGEYCWLFGDDDLIGDGVVGMVLAEVQAGHDLIIVNASVRDRNLRSTLKASMLDASADESFGPNELARLFAMIVPYVSFIGCVVIKRDLWLNREKDRYIGSEFIHVGVIFQAPLPGGSRVLARPGITIRYGNALWSPRAVEIWVKKWSEVLRSLDCIPETLIREKAWQWSVASLKRVVVWRAVGAYSFGTFRSLMSGRSIPLWWRVAAAGVAWLPEAPVNSLLLAYFKAFRKEDWQTIYDLSTSRHNWFRRRGTPGR